MKIDSIINKIYSEVKEAENILVVGHQNPDGDSLGSMCAFSIFLDLIGKQHSLYCLTAYPDLYNYLPAVDKIETEPQKIIFNNHDLIIAFDSGDLGHAGLDKILPKLKTAPKIINIDHHPTNTNYGDVNLIIPEAASATEIIFRIFNQLNVAITKNIANCLLTGILGDTNYFSNFNTTDYSVKAASELLIKGAVIPQIFDFTRKNKNLPSLKLWGKILSRIYINKKYHIAVAAVTRKDINDCGAGQDSVEGISDFIKTIEGVRILVVLFESEESKVKVSLRTNDQLIDLTKIVKIFGGGGHKKAAGFSVKGRLVETEQGWQVI